MPIAHLCKRQFSSHDWNRGEQYFRQHKVRIYESTPTQLDAFVRGSEPQPYQVTLDWSRAEKEKILEVDCSCPRFADMGECKHIVATILEADATRTTDKIPKLSSLSLNNFPDSNDVGDQREEEERDEYEDDGWFEVDDASSQLFRSTTNQQNRVASTDEKAAKKPFANWKTALTAAGGKLGASSAVPRPHSPETEQRITYFILDLAKTAASGQLSIALRQRVRKKDGSLGVHRSTTLYAIRSEIFPNAEQGRLFELLHTNTQIPGFANPYYGVQDEFRIAPALYDVLLPLLCATGQFQAISGINDLGDHEATPLKWDSGPSWKLRMAVTSSGKDGGWELRGKLHRENEICEVATPKLILQSGIAIFDDHLARFDAEGDFSWTYALRQSPMLRIPASETEAFVTSLAQLEKLPPIDLPKALTWKNETPIPGRQLTITRSKYQWARDLDCHLSFAYGDRIASEGSGQAVWYDKATSIATRRNWVQEHESRQQLLDMGFKRGGAYGSNRDGLQLDPKKMPALIQRLVAEGWQVTAEGRLIQKATHFSVSVAASGVDWFDLDAKCDFGETSASLPQLLEALKKNDGFIELDDGSKGILPSEWLQRYGALGKLGKREGDTLRYTRTQAVLLDTLLMEDDRTKVSIDKTFAQLRHKLKSFSGIKSASPPATFKGELRPYQKEGLGWLHYLDDFGFGGCLADDMGLGKTVQVLAMLEKRRTTRARANSAAKGKKADPIGPSLVVVPKSLVFNWIEEAKRFTPKLKMLNFTGLGRAEFVSQIPDHDVVITTYSTMRLEIERLREHEFDYVILDESQAIKNANSQAAKASLLLKSRRRLAMSGTPIENHLGELQSLLEFLNPGLLGGVGKLSELFTSEQRSRPSLANTSTDAEKSPATLDPQVSSLGRAIRPFLLRRTKEQVLKELPAKTEQTLYCELPQEQRTLYDELKRHYRESLLERVDKFGLKKSKIQVLTALLRLRQAACHPGLLNDKKKTVGSAKLESLLERLAEVVEEGHKALVFSQFTSFLSIVRAELDKQKLVYEYLDGKTTRRQEKVDRFQTDAKCPVFLISLKAGGLGLNLTAADYVFILDPWWNPAVEAQAVDRAHRMGQKKHVFAYRLIAKDTVEEKILALQQQKRQLADAIVNADSSLIQSLTSEDLQLLLS